MIIMQWCVPYSLFKCVLLILMTTPYQLYEYIMFFFHVQAIYRFLALSCFCTKVYKNYIWSFFGIVLKMQQCIWGYTVSEKLDGHLTFWDLWYHSIFEENQCYLQVGPWRKILLSENHRSWISPHYSVIKKWMQRNTSSQLWTLC